MSGQGPFVDQLREQLVAAAGREAAARRARRRPHRLAAASVAAVAAAVLAAAVVVLLPQPGPAAAEVVIRVEGGAVEVTLLDLEHSPERIEAAVRAAGLDVSVRGVPVGPSRVGRFVGQESSGPLPPELARVDDAASGFRGFVLPEGWRGSLRLLIGEPASGDEPYIVFGDAFAPGEPLACSPLLGRPAAEVARSLAGEPLTVHFDAVEGITVTPLDPGEVVAAPWAPWLVVSADSLSRRSVVVRLAPPGSVAPPPHPECSP